MSAIPGGSKTSRSVAALPAAIPPRVVFVTGTDTGVGKTVLTGLILAHLRGRGVRAHALKPFCSGGTGDVDLLDALQDGELPREVVNPYLFPEPVSPLVAARRHRRRVRLPQVMECIREAQCGCECLLIEGAGGLLAPLGEGFSAAEIIAALRCEVVVAAFNRLGVINHVLLTLRALRALPIGDRAVPRTLVAARVRPLAVVLMNPARLDLATATNAPLLKELLAPTPLIGLPFLGPNCDLPQVIRRAAQRLRVQIEEILG